MAEQGVSQHKDMAMGKFPVVEGVQSPWKSVQTADHSGKGVLSDSQRSGKKA